MKYVMECHDERAQWKVDEGEREAACLSLVPELNEELRPDPGPYDVREAGDKEGNHREPLDSCFHVALRFTIFEIEHNA